MDQEKLQRFFDEISDCRRGAEYASEKIDALVDIIPEEDFERVSNALAFILSVAERLELYIDEIIENGESELFFYNEPPQAGGWVEEDPIQNLEVAAFNDEYPLETRIGYLSEMLERSNNDEVKKRINELLAVLEKEKAKTLKPK